MEYEYSLFSSFKSVDFSYFWIQIDGSYCILSLFAKKFD